MNKSPNIPTFSDAMRNFAYDAGCQLYVHLPGNIVSYDSATQTAVVSVAMKKVIPTVALPASLYTLPYPDLHNVPVFFLQAGGVSVGGDPQPEDPCVICIMDRNIDAWKAMGGKQPPPSDRVHDLADAFVLVGLNPSSATLKSARETGEFGIAEAAAGTGAALVVKDGLVSIRNNTEDLATILTTLLTALGSATSFAEINSAAAAAGASLADLLY